QRAVLAGAGAVRPARRGRARDAAGRAGVPRMSRLRVALLGCGGVARRHADAAAALPHDLELVACCGRDARRTAAFAGRQGAAAESDVDEVRRVGGPDLVIGRRPPCARGGEVERVARAGGHFLVARPLALDVRSAELVAEAARSAGVVAAVGFMYRFGDAVR